MWHDSDVTMAAGQCDQGTFFAQLSFKSNSIILTNKNPKKVPLMLLLTRSFVIVCKNINFITYYRVVSRIDILIPSKM